MPAVPSSTKASGSKAPPKEDGLHDPKDDICPVCKSSRYFNPNMRLLVSPECWHRMCEACVNRIFGSGPGPCPTAGCKKTLRKQRFREQTFDDLRVEREIEIRREVADIMSRREADFDSLDAYNDYLEQCESMTFNLVHGVDVAGTRAALDAFRAQNAAALKSGAERERDEREEAAAHRAAEREAAKLRRRAAAREAEEERRDRANANRDIVDSLARGGGAGAQSAASIARAGHKSLAQRLQAKRADFDAPPAQAAAAEPAAFAIRGLKARSSAAQAAQKPYSPFAGVHYAPRHAVPAEPLRIDLPPGVPEEAQSGVGGWDARADYRRALVDAFAGLGVFVGDELAARDAAAAPESVGAVTAAAEAQGGGR